MHEGHDTNLPANSRATLSASPSLDGSFPPACAICGRPPPPPPAAFAVSRIQSPALSPIAITSSLTAKAAGYNAADIEVTPNENGFISVTLSKPAPQPSKKTAKPIPSELESPFNGK